MTKDRRANKLGVIAARLAVDQAAQRGDAAPVDHDFAHAAKVVDDIANTKDTTLRRMPGGRRRTHRMLFKKWAAQEAKRMTFKKWAAHELKETSHRGNPSFAKWAKQEMREKSHTRRRQRRTS